MKLALESLRNQLIRQEETIIFNLIERAQFRHNPKIYEQDAIPLPDQKQSFLLHLLHETEVVHAKVRRYTCPEEHPFTSPLPPPILPVTTTESPIRPNKININSKILHIYIETIVPQICSPGDDGNYGSSAVNDVLCLQALSKRIHYGKFIAEAKFQEDPEGYSRLIKQRDEKGILDKLRNPEVEERLLKRVHRKASTYGQDLDEDNPTYKIQPDMVVSLYRDIIIPLTCEVEVLYLLERLNP